MSTCLRPPDHRPANQKDPSAGLPLPDLFGVAQLDVGALLDELGVSLQEVDAPTGGLLQVVELILKHNNTTQLNTTHVTQMLLIVVLVLIVLLSTVFESPDCRH